LGWMLDQFTFSKLQVYWIVKSYAIISAKRTHEYTILLYSRTCNVYLFPLKSFS
jgi:hypothetical protein